MPDLAIVAIVIACIVGFFAVSIPATVFVNRALGMPYLREAERVKATLANGLLRYSEDGMRLRVTALAPFAASVRWLSADVRVDQHALYVMQWRKGFGTIFGQPNLRMTWLKEPRVGGFLAAPIVGQPSIEDGIVCVPIELGWSAMKLRLSAKDPQALCDAIFAMR